MKTAGDAKDAEILRHFYLQRLFPETKMCPQKLFT